MTRRKRVLISGAALLVTGCTTEVPPRAPGDLVVDPTSDLRLRYVPPGRILLGSGEDEVGRDSDERQVRVELTYGFWAAESEVTQELWLEVTSSNPAQFFACGPDCPVERVSWYDAIEFANRLSIRSGLEPCYELAGCHGTFGAGCPEGQDWCHGGFTCDRVELRSLGCIGYRLPTEAEWEHAARAGSAAATWTGDFEIHGINHAPALNDIAWYGGNSAVAYAPAWDCSDWKEKQFPATACGTHPVRGKSANPWGLHDMLGNVWEWVWDRYGLYPEGPLTDPVGPASGDDRVRRGGSWASIPRHCRAADRNRETPYDRDRNWGLRLVRTDIPGG